MFYFEISQPPFLILFEVLLIIISTYFLIKSLLDNPQKYSITVNGKISAVKEFEIGKVDDDGEMKYDIIVYSTFYYDDVNYITTRYLFYPSKMNELNDYIYRSGVTFEDFITIKKELIGKEVLIHYDGKNVKTAYIELNRKWNLMFNILINSIIIIVLSLIVISPIFRLFKHS